MFVLHEWLGTGSSDLLSTGLRFRRGGRDKQRPTDGKCEIRLGLTVA